MKKKPGCTFLGPVIICRGHLVGDGKRRGLKKASKASARKAKQ